MRLLILLLLVHLGCMCIAADKVGISSRPIWLYPVKIDPTLKPDLKNVSNGFYLELIDRQLNVITQAEYNHFIRYIVNEAGVQSGSEVSVSFAPQYQQLAFHEVSIIRNGEIVSKLDPKEIKVVTEENNTDDYLYDGRKRAFIILKDTRKGDRIDISYTITGFNPIFKNKFSTQRYFYSSNPHINYFETIIAEPERKLLFTSFNNATSPEEKIIGGKKIYHWANPRCERWRDETGSPSWHNSYPFFTLTEFRNWSEVADWGLQLVNNYRYELPAGLKKKVEEWKKASEGNTEAFASRAVQYVQDNIRYVGLEMGIHSHQPHTPKEVFENAYGDCKDKSLLLALILREAGMDASVALVSTTRRGEMYKAVASPDEFNHAIVAVRKESGYQYVDATYTLQRGEFSELFTPDYGYALLLKEGENNLRAVETSFINSTYIVEELTVSFEDTSRLHVTTTYKGGRADNIRRYFSQTGVKDIERNYTDYYSGVHNGIKMVGEVEFFDDSIVNAGTVTEGYVIPKLWDIDKNKKKSFNVYARSILEELTNPGDDDSTNYPISLSYPSSVYYTLKIEMPENWNFPEDNLHIKNDCYEFDFKVEVKGSLITLKYFLKTFKDHIPVSELAQYRKDYKNISDVVEYTLSYIEPSAIKSSGGGINWTVILFSVLFVTALAFAFRIFNRKTIEVEYDRDSGWKIGGWMVVLGISLAVSVIINTYSLFSSNYFDKSYWNIWSTHGNFFVATIYIELAVTIFVVFYALANIFWFLKRRDIFPKMFLWYTFILIALNILLYGLYISQEITSSDKSVMRESTSGIFRSLIYAAIWGTYIMRSYRAKATFLKGV